MSLVAKYQILPPIYPILEQIGDSDSKKCQLQSWSIFTNWKIWFQMSLVTKHKKLAPIYPILEEIGDADSKNVNCKVEVFLRNERFGIEPA